MALLFVAPRYHYRARRITMWGAIAWILGSLALAAFALSG